MQEKIKEIKEKLQLLIKQYQHLQKENLMLNSQLAKSRIDLAEKHQIIQTLQQKITTTQISSSQLNSQDKQIIEKRINGYIKEIDTCLTLLSKD